MAILLHVSDIHAGSPEFDSCVYSLGKKISDCLSSTRADFLVCSGDLSFRGKKEEYTKAIDFIKKISIENSVPPILVPGNHDICRGEKSFTSFDAAAQKMNEQLSGRFSERSCHLFKTPQIDFFLANSSYLGECTYGEIDIAELEKMILNNKSDKKKILITHHPLLAAQNDKCSSVRNAREVLFCLTQNAFTAVLHGHQHMNTRFGYKFENSIIDVIGIRSLFLPASDVPIGAQMIYVNETDVQVKQIDLARDAGTSW